MNGRMIGMIAGLALVLAGCGGGGGGGGAATGAVSGTVVSSVDGTAISGATVSSGDESTLTASDGSFTLTGLAASARTVVKVKATGYAEAFRIADVDAGRTAVTQAQLLPYGTVQTVDAGTGGVVAIPGSTATVDLAAGSLADAAGSAVGGNVTVALTAVDAAGNINTMPGDFATGSASAPDTIESFGAIGVEITDAGGNRLNLASGQTATVRIPLSSRNGSPAASIPLYAFNEATGLWVQEGTATLQGTAPDQYYEGTVAHFSWWNADQVMDTINVNGCVEDELGRPVSYTWVHSEGIDYSGAADATTDTHGNFSIAIKSNGLATINALKDDKATNTVSAGPSTGDYTLPACLVQTSLANAPTITLTWGADPWDLDSHLYAPDGSHVWYADTGSLVSDPYAALDVDDVTSYGPEVVTLRRLMVGTYTYVVNNFSESTPGISGSPARVEFRRGSLLNVFTPPGGENATVTNYWTVFTFSVDAQCNVTAVTPVGAWSAVEPTPAVVAQQYCTP